MTFKIKNIKLGRNGSYKSESKAIHYAFKKAEEYYTDLMEWGLSDFSIYTKEWEGVLNVYCYDYTHQKTELFCEIHTV